MDCSQFFAADNGQTAHDLYLVDKASYEDWLKGQPARSRALLKAQNFKGDANQLAIMTGDGEDDWSAVLAVAQLDKLNSWSIAKAAEALPGGDYRLANDLEAGDALLGWMLAQYRFDAYRGNNGEDQAPRCLLIKRLPQAQALAIQAQAVARVRDMVNTPAEDMGPDVLEALAQDIADRHDANLTITRGDMLEQDYPMVHAVGRAAKRGHAPRLLEMEWGHKDHPRIALVGKGVCFDSGGLDIKPAAGMRWMKKDMGGAAHVLALAELIMRAKLPVRLHMLIPAVENAIAGNAFRPGDVLTSRKGISVEIGNTDAEGRLVLGDALTKAGEAQPELIIDFATLTGAARIALGPDLPAMFTNDDALADSLAQAGENIADPVWRLPLWEGYADFLKSDIADINNSGGAMAGSVTAALFLKRFVPGDIAWVHFDTFAWRPAAKPGQPKGGEALGLRAMWHYLLKTYG